MNQTETVSINEDANCPICGYFIGAGVICPRCGAKADKKMSVKVARAIALLGSFLGILLLWVATKSKEAPLVQIGNLNETNNSAYVKLVGQVEAVIEKKDKNGLKIVINDGTGKISLNAFNKLKKFHEHFNALGKKFPQFGDKIEVTGSINISQAWGPSMFLTIPDRLKILKRYKIKKIELNDISINDKGEIYKIKVVVSNYNSFKTKKGKTLYSLSLQDNSGEMSMTLFSSMLNKMDEKVKKKLTTKGNELELVVKVDSYNNRPQIKILDYKNPEYIKLLGTKKVRYISKKYNNKRYSNKRKKVRKIKIADITEDMIGDYVKIRAKIRKIRTNKGGKILSLSDNTGRIKMFLSKKLEPKLGEEADYIEEGAIIVGIAKVSTFREELQLSLATSKDFKVEE